MTKKMPDEVMEQINRMTEGYRQRLISNSHFGMNGPQSLD